MFKKDVFLYFIFIIYLFSFPLKIFVNRLPQVAKNIFIKTAFQSNIRYFAGYMFYVHRLQTINPWNDDRKHSTNWKKKQTFCARKDEQTFKSFKNRYASTFESKAGYLSLYLFNASFRCWIEIYKENTYSTLALEALTRKWY